MQKFYQSSSTKSLKLMSLICFLFLSLAGCQGNDSGDDSIASQLTAPNIIIPDSANVGIGSFSLFSVDSDVEIDGYEILYQVVIGSDEEFTDTVYDQHVSVQEMTTTSGTIYTPNFDDVAWPELNHGETYYIKVRRVARKEGEEDIVGDYSDAAEFNAPNLTCFIPVPETTELDSQLLNFSVNEDIANCSTILTTLISVYSIQYEFQLASDQAFSSIEATGTIDISDLANPSKSFTLANTLNDGTYYWRVRIRVVIDADTIIVGPYSEARPLSVAAATTTAQ